MTVHLVRHDGGVFLTVNDDGPGIRPELREAVFDEFQTGDTESSGSGIGLSVVRRCAELHGGRVWIEEAPDGGASLNVMLSDLQG